MDKDLKEAYEILIGAVPGGFTKNWQLAVVVHNKWDGRKLPESLACAVLTKVIAVVVFPRDKQHVRKRIVHAAEMRLSEYDPRYTKMDVHSAEVEAGIHQDSYSQPDGFYH